MRTVPATLVLLLLATIPASLSAADVTGRWTGQMVLAVGATTIPFVLDLKADGRRLSGTICFNGCTADKPQPIQNAQLNGTSVSFSAAVPGANPPQLDFRGTITGDTTEFILSGKAPQCLGMSCEEGEAPAKRTTITS